MDSHQEIVNDIVSRVRQFHSTSTPFKVYHGATNSTRKADFQRDRIVDTSKLSRVLKVDTSSKTALVEPNVPMDALVDATLKHGLLPPVVMEFPGITVGGGYAGTAGESSSFKHGFFNSTISWIEIVLANGDVVEASEKENSDLFIGAAGSFGSLGVLTLLEIKLVEARKYVEVTYHPVKSMEEAVEKTKEERDNDENDYLDGILFSKTSGAIVSGRLTNEQKPGMRVQGFTGSRDPWFYLHVQDLVSKSTEPSIELVPIVDYLFRYDRGAFWTGEYAFEYFKVPFNGLTRWALDHFMHTRVMYHALHKSGHADKYVIQDLALPISRAAEFVEWVDKTLGFYPLWLCPLRPGTNVSMSPHSQSRDLADLGDESLLNVGVWGPGPTNRSDFIKLNRELEQIVRKLGGVKWLYAHAYYTEEEFWTIYDKESYDKLRQKYHATSLPTVYEKVKAKVVDPSVQQAPPETWRDWVREKVFSVWPLSGVYGVFRAVLGGDYLLRN